MKKLLSISLVILLAICASTVFFGCGTSSYCDPKGKYWYNYMELPSVINPYRAVYDGSYTVTIYEDGTAYFNPGSQVLKGQLIGSSSDKNSYLMQFEDGTTAKVSCSKSKNYRYLSLIYEDKIYSFSGNKQYTKDEFDNYLSQFIEFLSSVYQTGDFPTEEEIKDNDIYWEFTSCRQIDPCCNGPLVYSTVEKITITRVSITEDESIIVFKTKDGAFVREVKNDFFVASIKDGQLITLTLKDITEGECLAAIYDGCYGFTDRTLIAGIYYIND